MQWNPHDYAKNSEAQLQWAKEIRSRLLINGSESVLDVGCGDGKITADFAQALPHGRVIGIDSAPEMIDYANATYSNENLSFACIDARTLTASSLSDARRHASFLMAGNPSGFGSSLNGGNPRTRLHSPPTELAQERDWLTFSNQFYLIFSNAVLHWVDDHLAFLKGASQALKPNGRLITSCGGAGDASDILTAFSETVTQAPWNAYFPTFRNPYYFYDTAEYETWLKAAGLKIERLELVPKDMTHSGESGLSGWLRTAWMPFTQAVPEPERDRFIAAVTQTYLAKFPLDANGLSHVRMVQLEVEAHC